VGRPALQSQLIQELVQFRDMEAAARWAMQCKIPLEHLPFELQNYLTTHRVRCVDHMNYSPIPLFPFTPIPSITPPFYPLPHPLCPHLSPPLSHPHPLTFPPSPSSPRSHSLHPLPPSLPHLLSYHSLLSDTYTHTHTHTHTYTRTHTLTYIHIHTPTDILSGPTPILPPPKIPRTLHRTFTSFICLWTVSSLLKTCRDCSSAGRHSHG